MLVYHTFVYYCTYVLFLTAMRVVSLPINYYYYSSYDVFAVHSNRSFQIQVCTGSRLDWY